MSLSSAQNHSKRLLKAFPQAATAIQAGEDWTSSLAGAVNEPEHLCLLVSNEEEDEEYELFSLKRGANVTDGKLHEVCWLTDIGGAVQKESCAVDDVCFEDWYRQYGPEAAKSSVVAYIADVAVTGDDYLHLIAVPPDDASSVTTWELLVEDGTPRGIILVAARKHGEAEWIDSDYLPLPMRVELTGGTDSNMLLGIESLAVLRHTYGRLTAENLCQWWYSVKLSREPMRYLTIQAARAWLSSNSAQHSLTISP